MLNIVENAERKEMTTFGVTYCDCCEKEIEARTQVKYKGKDFHKSCFLKEVKVTDQKKNPPIKMVLQPQAVENLLEVMEVYLSSSSSSFSDSDNSDKPPLYDTIKSLYADIALRLAQAGKGFGVCSHCGRAKHYEKMVANGKSQKKILNVIATMKLIVKGKVLNDLEKSQNSRVLLFCNDACDKLFSTRPLNEQIENLEQIKDMIKKKANLTPLAAPRPVATPTQAPTSVKAAPVKKVCVSCGKDHAKFECEECGAWLGLGGNCLQDHQLKHVEEQIKEEENYIQNQSENEIINFANCEAEIRTRLRKYDTAKLKGMIKSAKFLKIGMSIKFGGTQITANEWNRLLAEVLSSKRIGGLG